MEELIAENDELSAIVVKDVKNGELKHMTLDGLFAAVGQAPQSAPFASLVATQGGYYDANIRGMAVLVPNMDVNRQALIDSLTNAETIEESTAPIQ